MIRKILWKKFWWSYWLVKWSDFDIFLKKWSDSKSKSKFWGPAGGLVQWREHAPPMNEFKWLVESENAFSSRRIIRYSTIAREIERQNGPYIFIGKFHKSEHIFWSCAWNLLRIVQNSEKMCSFRMRYLACPGKFCGKSCGSLKVRWNDQNFRWNCSPACILDPREFYSVNPVLGRFWIVLQCFWGEFCW